MSTRTRRNLGTAFALLLAQLAAAGCSGSELGTVGAPSGPATGTDPAVATSDAPGTTSAVDVAQGAPSPAETGSGVVPSASGSTPAAPAGSAPQTGSSTVAVPTAAPVADDPEGDSV